MIDAKTAVKKAFRYFNDLFGSFVKDPLLEEVEMTDDKAHWLVTISFNVLETVPLTPLEEVMADAKGIQVKDRRTLRRKARILRVNAEDGHVESMKAVEA